MKKCQCVVGRGARKGEVCGNRVKAGKEYCGHHSRNGGKNCKIYSPVKSPRTRSPRVRDEQTGRVIVPVTKQRVVTLAAPESTKVET